MSDTPSRRGFLKVAGVLAAGAAAGATACERAGAPAAQSAPATTDAPRAIGFHRPTLDALAEVVLPGELGTTGRTRAVDAFVQWVDGYAPVAEEMHGYGYADVRYLPPDPAPAWKAQLEGLDLLARRARRAPFAALAVDARRALVTDALSTLPGDHLPAPLAAPHVALALLSHWAASPGAWDLAYGARITPLTCRSLRDTSEKPRSV